MATKEEVLIERSGKFKTSTRSCSYLSNIIFNNIIQIISTLLLPIIIAMSTSILSEQQSILAQKNREKNIELARQQREQKFDLANRTRL